jgi:hypothetical protein
VLNLATKISCNCSIHRDFNEHTGYIGPNRPTLLLAAVQLVASNSQRLASFGARGSSGSQSSPCSQPVHAFLRDNIRMQVPVAEAQVVAVNFYLKEVLLYHQKPV